MDREIAGLKRRLDELEARFSFLLRRLNIAAEDLPRQEGSQTVVALLRSGDEKAAIRAFMDETSCSLKDAKRHIESLKG
jgi:hypothetical protein